MVCIIAQINDIVKTLHSMSLLNTMSMIFGNGNYHAVVLKHQSDRNKGTENEQHTLGTKIFVCIGFKNTCLYSL